MAKSLSIKEVMELITPTKKDKKGKKIKNRFNKEKFNALMTAMANDVEFKETVAKKLGNTFKTEDIFVTKGFRKWLKKQVEKAGIDSKESAIILTNNFQIDDMEPLYDFFVSAMYQYMKAGNRFEMHTHEDFQGSLSIDDEGEKTKVSEAKNPATGESLGKFEYKTKKYKKLKVKSSAPKWLTDKRSIK